MKFKKKITVCRHDEEAPLNVIMQSKVPLKTCSALAKGICTFDNKKCKIITYVRET